MPDTKDTKLKPVPGTEPPTRETPQNLTPAPDESKEQRDAREETHQATMRQGAGSESGETEKELAQRVMDLYQSVHVLARTATAPDSPGTPLVGLVRDALTGDALQRARLTAEAILTDTPVLRAGPDPGAMSSRVFPTGHGAVSTTDHVPQARTVTENPRQRSAD
jgi:hypothetical protein